MNIDVIIATSNERFDNLFSKALPSALTQSLQDSVRIIIVDDNQKDCTRILQNHIKSLATTIPINVIRNTRTKHYSGTGAWNSGAMQVLQELLRKNLTLHKSLDTQSLQDHYLAFLDDDDSWEREYLQECANAIKNHNKEVALVATGISFIDNNERKILFPKQKLLTKEHIFLANPHIQGSNLFINLATFFAIGGFDESLKSTTDRDLLMRYVEYQKAHNSQTLFINKPLVNYYYDDSSVTQNKEIKHLGLHTFYRKYILEHSQKNLNTSLQRAKKLFNYKLDSAIDTTALQENLKPGAIQDSLSDHSPSAISLILGVISYDLQNLKSFLESFFALNPQKSPFLQSFMLVILSAKSYKKAYETFINTLAKEQRQAMYCVWLERVLPIAQSRTALQNAIYQKGSIRYKKNFVSWILDDDFVFYGLMKNTPHNIDYFYHIAHYYHAGIDICISKNCGEAPLPFFSLLRTQMLDLYATCKKENVKSDLVALYQDLDSKLVFNFSEKYYDYTSQDYRHLECPFYSNSLAQHIQNLKKGIMSTRQLEMQVPIGTLIQKSIHRGGNTIIYNPQALLVCNFSLDETYNRRSDFHWAIVNAYIYERKIYEISLPLTHIRGQKSFSYKNEIEKFQKDFLASSFYRIFIRICKAYKQNLILTPQEITKQYEDMVLTQQTKLYATLYRIDALHKQIQSEIPKAHQQSYESFSDIVMQCMQDFKNLIHTPYQLTNTQIQAIYTYLNTIA